MFDTKFCKISYLERYDAVFCEWKKFCEKKDYREPLEFGLELINKKNATTWITDTTNGFESNPEDTAWLLEKFIPKTIDSSCKKIVFLIEDDSPLKAEIDAQAEALSKYFEVECCVSLENSH